MVKIKLRRMGAAKKPSYRVVVADVRTARGGAYIDNIGTFEPRTDPPTVKIDEEKALMWLRRGAKPTDKVAKLLTKAGILEKLKAPAAE